MSLSSIAHGKHVATELCMALGIDPCVVSGLSVHIDVDSVVRVDVRAYGNREVADVLAEQLGKGQCVVNLHMTERGEGQ